MSQDEDDDDVDDDEEEEVTRCLCGHAEYQGDDGSGDSTSDGFFIQCDKCHVWQHGFCVGIMDSSSAPDEYWCEKCKPDLHKLITKPHGYDHLSPSQRQLSMSSLLLSLAVPC